MGRGLPTAAQAAEGTQNVLEHDNDESIEALSNKIVALKSVCLMVMMGLTSLYSWLLISGMKLVNRIECWMEW